MIVKGFSITRGQSHATHLLRADDNEHVELHELRGFVSDDLHGAFKEAESIARGTKCQRHLFSCAFSPPESARLSKSQFLLAIEKTEEALGLEGQPRAVVFHEKDGRRHAHCVWSRIDAQSMTAKHLSHWKVKLGDVSRALHEEFGIEMPKGLRDKTQRDPFNFTMAEWQAAKRHGEDPRLIKETVQQCWAASDGRAAFASSLKERGYWLAQGDRRGFVVVDLNGEVHALSRVLGCKTKEVNARLGKPDDLPSVEQTQKDIANRMTPALKAHVQKARNAAKEEIAALRDENLSLRDKHRLDRAELDQQLTLEWNEATVQRAARMPRGIRGVWSWITGKSREIRAQNTAEAEEQKRIHEKRAKELSDRQLDERGQLQGRINDVRMDHATRLKELRREVGMFLKLSRHDGREREVSRSRSLTREFPVP